MIHCLTSAAFSFLALSWSAFGQTALDEPARRVGVGAPINGIELLSARYQVPGRPSQSVASRVGRLMRDGEIAVGNPVTFAVSSQLTGRLIPADELIERKKRDPESGITTTYLARRGKAVLTITYRINKTQKTIQAFDGDYISFP